MNWIREFFRDVWDKVSSVGRHMISTAAGLIAGGATGIYFGIHTGVTAMAGGINGAAVFGPLGALVGALCGLLIAVTTFQARLDEAQASGQVLWLVN